MEIRYPAIDKIMWNSGAKKDVALMGFGQNGFGA